MAGTSHAELRRNDIVGPVRLVRAQHLDSDWTGDQISELKSGRVRGLGNHRQLERQPAVQCVPAVADSAERQLQVVVLPPSAPLDNDLGGPLALPAAPQFLRQPLEAELQRKLVWICGKGVTPRERQLLNH